MAFQFSERMIHDYRTQGYVIFRQVLPPSLIRDLRRGTAKVHEFTRQSRGPQVQRLQPIPSYPEVVDLKAMWNYATHAPLVDAIHKILTPRHNLGASLSNASMGMALLLEPAKMPWSTDWHRDIRETHDVPDLDEFRRLNVDPLHFNQINCPLYEDNCTWYVPGSYLRQFDLPEETAVVERGTGVDDKTAYEEAERKCLEYSQSMPGSIRVSMDAGDFALYHPNGWHLGNYLPDRKRCTIHDVAPTPELIDWYARWSTSRAAAAEKKKTAEAAITTN